jgi:hypothetical protein
MGTLGQQGAGRQDISGRRRLTPEVSSGKPTALAGRFTNQADPSAHCHAELMADSGERGICKPSQIVDEKTTGPTRQ